MPVYCIANGQVAVFERLTIRQCSISLITKCIAMSHDLSVSEDSKQAGRFQHISSGCVGGVRWDEEEGGGGTAANSYNTLVSYLAFINL